MKALPGSRYALAIWLWAGAVAAGSLALVRYESTAGLARTAPAEWPVESKIARSGDMPTLVMFVHPECACTQASLGELDRVLAQCPARVRVFVLVLNEASLPEDAAETRIWRTAAVIQRVQVLRDANGEEARVFHAMTSGHTLLYSADGRLLFAGGITLARGHAGDNAGSDALCALLWGGKPERLTTPVFGCPLFSP
jgi:hypothetical protein